MSKNHISFAFWLHDKEALEFRRRKEEMEKRLKRKVGVTEIVRPSIDAFLSGKK